MKGIIASVTEVRMTFRISLSYLIHKLYAIVIVASRVMVEGCGGHGIVPST